MPKLPKSFLSRMQELLQSEEYQDFLNSYDKEPKKGIRINPLKDSKENIIKQLPDEFEPEPISWCETGLYIDSEARPGKQPYYYTGSYYPQEPSAMIPAQVLSVEPGDKILDLCAAPGGKSTQLAGKLDESGILVANEIVGNRVGILASNIERMGIRNAVILNENPKHLADNFTGYFDKILVDAPCSGEGMFRKDEKVISEWTPERVEQSAKRQLEILDTITPLLKEGGELVYSTCTFAPEEDEQIIEALVDRGDFDLLPIDLEDISSGRKEFTRSGIEEIEKTARVWPHLSEGEGHFIARLKKTSPSEIKRPKRSKKRNSSLYKRAKTKDLEDFLKFKKQYLPTFESDNLYRSKDKLYLFPDGLEPEILDGLKVMSPGLLLGEFKKNRFEPSHTLAMALKKEEFANTYELSKEELWSYLKGEEISPEGSVENGWVLLLFEGLPVGFGKMSGKIKNKYPKGLRIYKK